MALALALAAAEVGARTQEALRSANHPQLRVKKP
jgi:hypothetical protein